MNTGILGGTFDPVHNAHLMLAREALASGLDEIWFLPCSQQALKAHSPHAAAEDRLEMLRLVTAGEARFSICTHELERGGTSYTIDTLEALINQFPERRFTCIIGMDSACTFPAWKAPDRLLTLCDFLVFERPGCPDPAHPFAQKLLKKRLSGIPNTLSSSELRKKIAQNEPIGYLIPRTVENYIRLKGLYRSHDHDPRTNRH